MGRTQQPALATVTQLPPLCACGCGEHVSKRSNTGKWNKYVHNHHWRGRKRKPFTEEHKAKISAIVIEQHKTNHPTRGKKCSNGSKAKLGSKNPNFGKFGADSANWKGGLTAEKGYVKIRMLEHPRAKNGYVLEHHLVVEEQLGRYLHADEIVHHINGKKADNHADNLYVTDRSGHRIAHESAFGVVCKLLEKGVVVFNRETGRYDQCA